MKKCYTEAELLAIWNKSRGQVYKKTAETKKGMPTLPFNVPSSAGEAEPSAVKGTSAFANYLDDLRKKGYSEKEMERQERHLRSRAEFENMDPDDYVRKKITWRKGTDLEGFGQPEEAPEGPGIGLPSPVAGKTMPEIATPDLPTGKPPLTPEQRKILDYHFPREAEKANVSPEDMAETYLDAVRNFVPGEDHVIASGPRKGEVVPGADVAKSLHSFIVNRKINAPKTKKDQEIRGPRPLPERERNVSSAFPGHGQDEIDSLSPEQKDQLDAIETLYRNSGPEMKRAIDDMKAEKTVSDVAKEQGISRTRASERNSLVKKLARIQLKKNMIAKMAADPETVDKAISRINELEAKQKTKEFLTGDEAKDLTLAKAIKSQAHGTEEFGFLYASFPPEFRKAMENMGGAMAKVANEENLNKIEDVASKATEGIGKGFRKIQEGVRLPVRSKHSRALSQAAIDNDREATRVTTRADFLFKDYFALESKDPERHSKITQVLIEEDQARERFGDDVLADEYGLSPEDIKIHKKVRLGIKENQTYEMARHKNALREELNRWLAKEDPAIRDETNRLISEGRKDPNRAKDLAKEAASLKKGGPDERLFSTNKRATILAGEYLDGLSKVGLTYKGNPGYVPHIRHGKYMMEIKGIPAEQDPNLAGLEDEPKEITVDAEMFDTLSQTKRFAEKYHVGEIVEFPNRKGVLTEYEITSITDPKNPKNMEELNVPEEGFMRAVNAFPIYEKTLAKHMSDEEIKHIREVLSDETLRFFAQGRLAKRKNIAGWSHDLSRSLKQFSASFPHAINRRYSIPSLQKIIDDLPAKDKPYAQDLLEYWRGSKKDLANREGPINQAVRSVIYNWFLGLKPAFYFLNATQILSTGYPVAVSMVGPKVATLAFGQALKKAALIFNDYTKAFKSNPHIQLTEITKNATFLSIAEKRAIERMASSGSIGASRTKEIIGKGKFSGAANIFGEISEKQNRVITALVGVRLAKAKGLNINDAIAMAVNLNDKVNFVYSKANRMKMSRGWLAPVTMFKSYLVNYWSLQAELLKADKKSFGLSMAILLALGGVAAIPGYDIARKLIPKLLRKTGIISDDEPIEKQIYDAETSIEKNDLANILLNGIPSLAKISGSMFGMGDPFGIAPFQIYNSIARTVRGISSDAGADWVERIARVSPTEVKRLIRLGQLVIGGKFATDEYGRLKITDEDLKRFPPEQRPWAIKTAKELPKPSDVSAWEKILIGLGFQTESVRKYSEGTYAIKSVGKAVLTEKGGMNREIGKLIAGGSGEVLAKRFKGMTPKVLEYNFSGILNRLSPDIKKEILKIKAESKRTGIAISYSSILSNIKEFIDQGNYQIRSNYGSRRKRVR